MICPMMSSKAGKVVADPYIECPERFCGWYNKEKEECCMKTIAKNIALVAEGDRTIRVQEV